jgi:hypothetical protein
MATYSEWPDCYLTPVSVFAKANSKKIEKVVPLFEIIKCIQTGIPLIKNAPSMKEKVEQLRALKLCDPSQFKVQKEECPNVSYHASFNTYLAEINITNWNGILPLDFDLKDVNAILPSDLISRLSKFDFILSAWISVSGTGVHALAYIPNIINKESFKGAYRELTVLFKNKLNVLLDQNSNHSTQILFLSYDPNILINKSPVGFRYNFNELIKDEYYRLFPLKVMENNIESVAIENFNFQKRIYNYWQNKLSSYYASLLLFDRVSKKPVQYNENLKFDVQKHYLQKFVYSTLISNQKYHNNHNTLAYIPEGVASVNLYIYSSRKFFDGHRRAALQAIMFKLAFIMCQMNKRSYSNLDLESFYYIAAVLNKRCFSKANKLGKEFPAPLHQNTLWFIAKTVYNKYISKSVGVTVDCKKFISTSDHISVCELPTDKNNKATRAREMLALIKRVKSVTEVSVHEVICSFISEMNPETLPTVPQLSHLISKYCKYKTSYIRNQLYKLKASQQDNIFQINSPLQFIKPKCNAPVPISEIIRAYQNLLIQGKKPTQQNISAMLSISIKTISKNWKQVLKQINTNEIS